MSRLDRSPYQCQNQVMERAIDVGGNYREWWFLTLVALTACLLPGGALLFATHHEAALPVLIAGAIAALVSALAAVAISHRRFSVQITPDGFLIRNRHGERQYTDEQVICASLYSTSNFSSGELKSITRVFDVWVEREADSERFKMTNRIPLGSADPLELLVERVIGHLYDRADAALAARQPFEGEGWALHANELVVKGKRVAHAVPVDELSATDVFDNDLCVWKHGQDEPVVRIPVRSANAAVLHRLLRDRLVEPSEATAPLDGNGLGRVLFERKPGRTLIVTVWLLPIAAFVLFAACAVASIVDRQLEPILIGGFLSLALTLLWLVPLSQCVRLRCHEHGVARCWLHWEKRLHFDDVDSFTYSAVRQYVKGMYSGTTFTLTFVSKAAGKPAKFTYAKTLRNADVELDHLRDHVSRVIAARMAAGFGTGAAVGWTDGLRFLSDGLEYRASGFLGRKAPIMVPYERITAVNVADGLFHLWVAGQKKPVVKEQVSQPNFFPGYLFLTRLMATRRETQLTETARST
jgi:hypothetical protein